MSANDCGAPPPMAEASPNCRATGRVTPRNVRPELDKLAARGIRTLALPNRPGGPNARQYPVQPSALHGITPT